MEKKLSLLRKFKVYGHRFCYDMLVFFRLNSWTFWGEKAVDDIFSVTNAQRELAILEQVAAATDDAPFTLDFAFGADTPASVKAAYSADTASTPARTTEADWHACNGFDVRARLPEVEVPVLVVYGSADRLTVPKFQAWLAGALPRCTAVALDGPGHMLPWEAPEALARSIRSWLAQAVG